MTKKAIITTLFAVILGLASCNRDSNYEDKVEQVTVYVSAETGMFYNVPNTTLEEGMLIRIYGEDNYICVAFNTIAGFTYEKGNEYELFEENQTRQSSKGFWKHQVRTHPHRLAKNG